MGVFSAEHGIPAKEFSGEVLEAMAKYSWPGNVRELRNEVERLVIMVSGDQIVVPDLSLPDGYDAGGNMLNDARARYERALIVSKLDESGWNVSQAARVLGLERSYLYRKMKAYGISKD